MPRSSFPDNVALASVVQYCGYPQAKPLQLRRSLLRGKSFVLWGRALLTLKCHENFAHRWNMLENVGKILLQLWIHENFSRRDDLLKPGRWPQVVPSIWLRTPSAEMPPKRSEDEGGLSKIRTPTANSKTKFAWFISRAIWIMLYPIKSCRLPRACNLIQVVACNARSWDSIISSLGHARRNIAKKRCFQTSLSAKSCQCGTRGIQNTGHWRHPGLFWNTDYAHTRKMHDIRSIWIGGHLQCDLWRLFTASTPQEKNRRLDCSVLYPSNSKKCLWRFINGNGWLNHSHFTWIHPEPPTRGHSNSTEIPGPAALRSSAEALPRSGGNMFDTHR